MSNKTRYRVNNRSSKSGEIKKRKKMTAKRRKKIIRNRLIFAFLIIAAIIGFFVYKNIKSNEKNSDANKVESKIAHVGYTVDVKELEIKYNEAVDRAKVNRQTEEARKEQLRQEQEIQKFKDESVHFVAVGDNLIHEKVYQSTNTNLPVWNYDHLYKNIKDYVSKADLAAVNQETIFVADHSQVSGYPNFGTPTEIGDALINAGFDIFECATNHAYDKGEYGIQSSVNYWRGHSDKTYLGIHDSQQDASNIRVVESKGIKIAMLNYTTLLNADEGSIPEYVIDRPSEERIAGDVAAAKQISDYVIVFLHDGTEYDAEPCSSQRIYENACLESGADALICSHSHVLEGFNRVVSTTGHEMLVYYGLGNFISSQEDAICLLGGMADFYIHKDKTTGECKAYYDQLVPLVTHYELDTNYFSVYFLSDYTDELAARHSITSVSGETVDKAYFEYYANIAQQAVY